MSAELVIKIEQIGGTIRLSPQGDKIRFRIPSDYPDAQDLMEELRRRKPEVIRVLQERQRFSEWVPSEGTRTQ